MTADLSALIARLEAAEAGSRELDAEIWLRFNRPEYTGGVKALEMRGWHDGRGHLILETDDGEEVADELYIGSATTSLDAALALAERGLPGWVSLITAGGDLKQTADLFGPVIEMGEDFEGAEVEIRDEAHGEADTPALALCIAILRAKQGEGE